MTVKVWRYSMPNDDKHYGGWFIAFVDQAGCLAVLSDYGDFSHRWYSPGADMRRTLLGFGAHYVEDKLGYNVESKLDGKATVECIKDHIVQQRRCGSMDKETAHLEWARIEDTSFENDIDFYDWMNETSIEEAYEFYRGCKPKLEAFMRQVWPRLRECLSADVAAETEAVAS